MKIRFNAPPANSGESNRLGVRYAPARREVPRWRWRLLIMLVLAAPLYLVVQFGAKYWWYTAPGFVVMEQLAVRPGQAGFIDRIVDEGARIQRGDTLYTLSIDPPLASASDSAARLDAAHAALALAEKQLVLRQQRLTTMRQLMQDGAATRADVDAELSRLYQAEADVIRGRANVAAASPASPNARSITQTAPIEGVVAQRYAHPGQWVSADTDVLVLQAERAPEVIAYIDPEHADYAQPGQEATLKFPGGESLSARVIDVSLQASRLPPERVTPLSPRTQSIVVTLEPAQQIDQRYRIHMLPLTIRFSRW